MKLPYHQKINSSINYLTNILVGSSISMLNVYGMSSSAKLWKTTTIYIYPKSDVLFLADLFEKFRNTCLHRLDPVHYYTATGLEWDAALRMSKEKLELITDIDMYNFIENSMISNRYARSNNAYNMCFESDSEKSKSHISYLDANNLYGRAMSQPLPTGGFKFLDEDEKLKFPVAVMNTVLSSMIDDDDIGYILKVDLQYPKALLASHNDYPLTRVCGDIE